MTMGTKKEYKKLPGRVVIGSRAGLWLGKDHLLSVKSPAFSEEYMRFYYRDIQAIVTTKTGVGVIWNLVLVFCIFIAFAMTVNTIPIPFFLMIGGVFLFFLVLNVLLGPTCKCFIQTAVNRELLPSLRRVRTAKRAIDRIMPLINAAQGGLTRADIVAKSKGMPVEMQPKAAEATPVTAEIPAAMPVAVGTTSIMTYYSGSMHLALFSALLLEGTAGTVDIFVNSMLLTIIGIVMTMSFVALAVIALVKQQGRQLNSGMRRSAWAALIYACATYVMGTIVYMYVFFQDPSVAKDQLGVIRTLTYLDPFEHPFLLAIDSLMTLAALIIGGTGIYHYSLFKARENRKGPSSV